MRSPTRWAMHPVPKSLEVFTAHDGNDGLIMIEREDPDLLLLEIMLPKRSDFQVVETLRMNQLVSAENYHLHGQRRQAAQGLC